MHGVPGIEPVLGAPVPRLRRRRGADSAQATSIARVGDEPVQTWQDARWVLLQHAVRKEPRANWKCAQQRGDIQFSASSTCRRSAPRTIDSDFLQALGLRATSRRCSP